MNKILTLAFAFLTFLSQSAFSEESAIVLFRADVVSISKVDGLDYSSYIPDKTWRVPVRATIVIREALIGNFEDGDRNTIMYLSSFPVSGFFDVFLLASRDAKGKLSVIEWGYANDEFCVGNKFVRQKFNKELNNFYRSGLMKCSNWFSSEVGDLERGRKAE